QRYVRTPELAERARVRILCCELRAQRFPHAVVYDEKTAIGRHQLHERDLVLLFRLEAELSAMVPKRKDVLVQLSDIERLRDVLRKARPDRAHEMTEHPLDVVHIA